MKRADAALYADKRAAKPKAQAPQEQTPIIQTA